MKRIMKQIFHFVLTTVVSALLVILVQAVIKDHERPLTFTTSSYSFKPDNFGDSNVLANENEYPYMFSGKASFEFSAASGPVKNLKLYYSTDKDDSYSRTKTSLVPFECNWVDPVPSKIKSWVLNKYKFKKIFFHFSFPAKTSISIRSLYLVGYDKKNRLFIYPVILKTQNDKNNDFEGNDFDSPNNCHILAMQVVSPQNLHTNRITLSDNASLPIKSSKFSTDEQAIESQLNFTSTDRDPQIEIDREKNTISFFIYKHVLAVSIMAILIIVAIMLISWKKYHKLSITIILTIIALSILGTTIYNSFVQNSFYLN